MTFAFASRFFARSSNLFGADLKFRQRAYLGPSRHDGGQLEMKVESYRLP